MNALLPKPAVNDSQDYPFGNPVLFGETMGTKNKWTIPPTNFINIDLCQFGARVSVARRSAAFAEQVGTSGILPDSRAALSTEAHRHFPAVVRFAKPLASFGFAAYSANGSSARLGWSARKAYLGLIHSVSVFANHLAAFRARNLCLLFRSIKTLSPPRFCVMLFAELKAPLRLSTNAALQFLRRVFVMHFSVLAIARNKLKILNSVVFPISVSMVNDFLFCQCPSKLNGHVQAMLKNLSAFPRIGMASPRNHDVSVGCNYHGSKLTCPL